MFAKFSRVSEASVLKIVFVNFIYVMVEDDIGSNYILCKYF